MTKIDPTTVELISRAQSAIDDLLAYDEAEEMQIQYERSSSAESRRKLKEAVEVLESACTDIELDYTKEEDEEDEEEDSDDE